MAISNCHHQWQGCFVDSKKLSGHLEAPKSCAVKKGILCVGCKGCPLRCFQGRSRPWSWERRECCVQWRMCRHSGTQWRLQGSRPQRHASSTDKSGGGDCCSSRGPRPANPSPANHHRRHLACTLYCVQETRWPRKRARHAASGENRQFGVGSWGTSWGTNPGGGHSPSADQGNALVHTVGPRPATVWRAASKATKASHRSVHGPCRAGVPGTSARLLAVWLSPRLRGVDHKKARRAR